MAMEEEIGKPERGRWNKEEREREKLGCEREIVKTKVVRGEEVVGGRVVAQ